MPRLRLFVALAMMVAAGASARATTYQVGPTRVYTDYSQLPNLAPGDIVEVDSGTYRIAHRWGNDHTWSGTAENPIIIRGVGPTRPIIDGTADGPPGQTQVDQGTWPKALNYSNVLQYTNLQGSSFNPRGMFQMECDHVIVEHFEFVNARNGAPINPDGKSLDMGRNYGNAAGIICRWVNGVVIRDCVFHDNDQGVTSQAAKLLTVENCEIHDNGFTDDGNTHNMYMEGSHLIVRGCNIYHSPKGRCIKTRAHYTEILYNYVHDTSNGYVEFVDYTHEDLANVLRYFPSRVHDWSFTDADMTYVPNSNAVMIGNVIESPHVYETYQYPSMMVNFGSEGFDARFGTLYLINNTFVSRSGVSMPVACPARSGSDLHAMAINNIFFNINNIAHTDAPPSDLRGYNNWVQASTAVPSGFQGTIVGHNPGFADLVNADYRLATWSTAKDRGVANATVVDGTGATVPAVPGSYYTGTTTLGTRPVDATIDVGAYEADASITPSPAATRRYDFGPAGSPVKSGYVGVDGPDLYDPGIGYGWGMFGTFVDSLAVARDRGAGVGDDLTRDFNYLDPNRAGRFYVDVPNGDYDVAVTLGDAGYGRGSVIVSLNGIQVDTVPTPTVVTKAYRVNVVDSRVDLTLYSATDLSCIAGLQVVPHGATLDPAPGTGGGGPPIEPPPSGVPMKYDFGMPSSPLATGYTRVSELTTYDSQAGYGWTAGVILSHDRLTGTDLTRDIDMGTDATFVVALAGGTYDVTLYLGDPLYDRNLMGVYLEDNLIDTVSVPWGQDFQRTYTVTVGDGQLTLRLRVPGDGSLFAIRGMDIALTPGTHPWPVRPIIHPRRDRTGRRR